MINGTSNGNFPFIYRGIVKDNTGAGGKCKIWVEGIYFKSTMDTPDKLPWAVPAAPLFGGNTIDGDTKTGITGWPAKDSWVWVFFELGNHNKPVYFAAALGEAGWEAANKDQWVIQTKNVSVKISEGNTATVDIKVKGKINVEVEEDVDITIKGKEKKTITGEQEIKAAKTTIDNEVLVKANITVTNGDVIADGVSLKKHTHQSGNLGYPTSPPTGGG
jgi:hypothetical protein